MSGSLKIERQSAALFCQQLKQEGCRALVDAGHVLCRLPSGKLEAARIHFYGQRQGTPFYVWAFDEVFVVPYLRQLFERQEMFGPLTQRGFELTFAAFELGEVSSRILPQFVAGSFPSGIYGSADVAWTSAANRPKRLRSTLENEMACLRDHPWVRTLHKPSASKMPLTSNRPRPKLRLV